MMFYYNIIYVINTTYKNTSNLILFFDIYFSHVQAMTVATNFIIDCHYLIARLT